MLKFIDVAVVTEEIPTEISLAVEITNCPHKCEGCHSPQLRENIGTLLSSDAMDFLLKKYPYISCFLFMGGDSDHKSIAKAADYIRSKGYKTAMYSGDDVIDKELMSHLDYYKVGSYQKAHGPLNWKSTNQHLYAIYDEKLNDITYMFWKNEDVVDISSMDRVINNFKDGKVSNPIDLKPFDEEKK